MQTNPFQLRCAAVSLAFAMALAWGAAADGGLDVIPVSELRPGMRGTGRTVFSGTQPEEFEVEILGVLEGAWPQGDMVIARLHGANIDETGVASGMSGSPVSIDGRLLGAIAFTWRDIKTPLCGISPISQMKEAFQPPAEDPPAPSGELVRSEGVPAVPRLGPEAPTVATPEDAFPLAPKPIMTPVFLSSFDQHAAEELAKHLAAYRLKPTMGGAAASDPEAITLKPGQVMGVQLIGGDMSAVAVGTVTYRDGDRVLGFGHPLFRAGPTELPMTGGRAIVTVPSRTVAFRMATGTEPVGTLVGDFPFGVEGIIGREAPVIPMRVVVKNLTRDRRTEYNYTLAVHPALTGMLSGYAAAASIARTEGEMSPFTASLRFEMDVEGSEPLVIEDRLYSGSMPSAVMGIGSLARLVMDNPWRQATIRSVNAEIEMIEGRHTAEIEGMRLSAKEVRPGDTLTVWVSLRPHQSGETFEEEIEIRIPDDMPPGARAQVVACDGFTSARLTRSQAPGRYRPYNLDQMLRILGDMPTGSELAVRVSRPGTGVTLEGAAFPNLPDSVRRVLTDAPRTGFETMREDAVVSVDTPWVVDGAVSLSIRIKEDAQP